MRVVLMLIALVWMGLGALIILYTQRTKSFLRGFVLGVNTRRWALTALGVGLLFILGAYAVPAVYWLVLAVGLLAVAKGVYLLLAPQPQVRSLLEWWFDEASEPVLRLWGVLAYTVGLVLLLKLL